MTRPTCPTCPNCNQTPKRCYIRVAFAPGQYDRHPVGWFCPNCETLINDTLAPAPPLAASGTVQPRAVKVAQQ